MNKNGLKTKAWYCSSASITGINDREFGVNIKWDVPLLDGYEFKFFKNYSWKPSHFNGFFGLINLGMIRELFRIPKSIIILHGWHYCSHFLILLLGKIIGHTVCLRFEIPQNQEVLKKGWKQCLKQKAYRYIIFPRIHFFLYIGKQNLLLYKSYNVKENRLLFCPYAVDNDRFKIDYQTIKPNIPVIKATLGVPAYHKIILFSGKYIEKKRPIDLLRAYIKLNKADCWLIFLGDGELRGELESLSKVHNLKQVIFTGFINQSQISTYYAISDVFVMCSGAGETWGLSVNEAMNFNLPIVVSDLTGCSYDLVHESKNGYSFKTGDINELALKLQLILYDKKLSWTNSSQSIVDNYSYEVITNNIRRHLIESVSII